MISASYGTHSVKQTETEIVSHQTETQIIIIYKHESYHKCEIVWFFDTVIFLLRFRPSGFPLSHEDLAQNSSPRTQMT